MKEPAYAVSTYKSQLPPQFTISVDDNFDITMSRVKALRLDDELAPTDYAYSNTVDLLVLLRRSLSRPFPRGVAAVGEDGDIFLYWQKPDFSIEVTLPAYPFKSRILHIYKSAGSSLAEDPELAQITSELLRFRDDDKRS